jgi:hypothetical protein
MLPSANWNAIVEDSDSGDGGRSGQFFFFNYDRTFLLKTVSLNEKTVYL